MFGVVPKTPVMTGITVALTFHNFCHSILSSRYLSTFFVLPEDNVLISWYCHIYHQTVFFLLWTQCLIALLQLPYLCWYWSPIEVYIYQFIAELLVYTCMYQLASTFNTVHFTKTREVFLLLCHVLSKIDFFLNLYKQPQYRWDTFCLFLA